MAHIRTFVSKIRDSFSNYFSSCFKSRRQTFKILALVVFTALFIIQASIIIINNSFYNNFSDDILQYYTIMNDFIASVKGGSLSLFNLNNYLGASFFSDVYYIPLDIFTFLTFILSYVMNVEIAYSIMELFKIFAGVMALAYFLHLEGRKNRTIFWVGIFYFVSGGMVSFMAFPAFLSMAFYLPLSLIVIHYFFNKKRWILPLFALIIIFYNFYLGYMILAFTSFAFILEYFKRYKFNLFDFLKKGIIFLGLLLLGVGMAGVILLPSINFILEETYRSTATFNAWIINIGSFELKLFRPEIYIRYLAKLVAEQKPIGFYGFENDYGLEHASLYITIIGFAYMSLIFFMKDKISRVYKISFLIALIFMFFPLFSYVFSGTLDKPYTRWINLLPLIEVLALAHVFDHYGFEKIKMKQMTIVSSLLILLSAFLVYYYIQKLDINIRYAGRETLTADTVMIGVSIAYLIIIIVFGWLKKFTVIKWFVWVEVIVALGYIYSGPFSISGKIDVFERSHDVNEFLLDNLDQDEFYRVYIDMSRIGLDKTNFNRMTAFPTNTYIFHSWTDSETNGIGKMIFNSNEYQSKSRMNYFGFYINHFLGYKYVLVDATYEFDFEEEYFSLIAENEKYQLYEINYSSNFRVYDTYFYSNDIDMEINNSLQDVSSALVRQKAFLMSAIIDPEKEYDMNQYDLNYLDNFESEDMQSIASYTVINGTTVVTNGFNDEIEREFYLYDEETIDINFTVGAAYIKFLDTTSLVSNLSQVFMEFSDGTRQACSVYTFGFGENEIKSPYHIKCEFWKRPVKIYVEKNENLTSAPVFKMRTERALDFAAYLTYDLSQLDLPNDKGFIVFDMAIEKPFEKVFIVDEFGDRYEVLDGYYHYETKPDKLYIFKTSGMYSYYDLYNLRLRYIADSYENLSDTLIQENIGEKYLSIKHAKIDLRFNNLVNSEKDQIVVIPVAYSEDWQFTSEQVYDTISVSGGFLGIVIPKGTTQVDLTMKFSPKYMDLGLYLSLGSLAIYGLIFISPMIIKKKKKRMIK